MQPTTPMDAPPLAVKTPPVLTYSTPRPFAIPPDWTNVEVFVLRPQALPRFLAMVVVIQLVMNGVLAAVFLPVAWFSADNLPDRIARVAFIAFVLAISTCISLALRLHKHWKHWHMFRLTVADEGLVQFAPPKAPMTVARGDIRQIVDEWDAFRVELAASHLRVPKRIEQPERVRDRLAAWQPIRGRQSAAGAVRAMGVTMLFAAGSSVSIVVGICSSNMPVVAACALCAIVLSVLRALRTWRNLDLSLWVKIDGLVSVAGALIVLARLGWLTFHG